jgi:hypothetical protein
MDKKTAGRRAAPWKAALGAAALCTLALPVLAATAPDGSLPAEQHDGQAGYLSGGIGVREAGRFERAMAHHDLAIELLEHDGRYEDFTADAQVRIADSAGRTVLATEAQGPFLLVDLPPGHYRIEARLNDTVMRKSATWVAPGATTRATFEFPAHTD